MWVRRTQYAIGQGGFHAEHIFSNIGDYVFVYDCGSWGNDPSRKKDERIRKDAIQRFINDYAPKKIDAIFISHLDTDHINGIFDLAKSVQNKVDKIYLPYLEPTDVPIHALRLEAEYGIEITEELVRFLLAPEEYFRERLDTDIVKVRPHDFDSPAGEEKEEIVILGEELDDRGRRGGKKEIPSGTNFTAKTHRKFWWLLRPYVIPIEGKEDKIRDLRTEVKNIIGSKPNASSILKDLKDVSNSKLKKAYECHIGKRKLNLTSMLLYSGPPQFGSKFFGWMNTGDAKTKGKSALEKFRKAYWGVCSKVQVLNLPHHGSCYNSDQDFIDTFENLRFALANASDNNTHKHPHPQVKGYVKKAGALFLKVNEHPHNDFEEMICLLCGCSFVRFQSKTGNKHHWPCGCCLLLMLKYLKN